MSAPLPLPPLSDEAWPGEIADMKDGFAGALNVYRTMAHHPALLRAWSDLRGHVVEKTALGREASEVVILRTGFRLGSDYEWRHHVVRARAHGLGDARILSLRGALTEMSTDDGLLCAAVDQLFADHALRPETAGGLMARFGATGALDLIATVGFYTTLGMLLKSCGTPLDADIAQALLARPLNAGDMTG